MLIQKFPKFIIPFYLILIGVSFVGTSLVTAQNEVLQSQKFPKMGLVLGGGSAGGFAHIGVLKWLEENRIPVDYITGTSMGGLMGGCYAMGMTPHEIENLAENIDWNSVFNPTAPFDSLNFRRKEDYRDYPMSGLGFRDHKISLPNGLSIYQIDMLLSRITLQYSLIKNFGDLPIPFRCIATDIRRGESVALKSGSLVKALRATMSIPAAFAPVEYNGRLLVDGGILNNLPVGEVKAMGADVVIAVNILSPPQNHLSENIGTVISQTLDTVTGSNVKPSAAMANMVLEPELTELGLYKWDAVKRYVELGYQAADRQRDVLLKYSLDESSWRQYLQTRKNRFHTDLTVPHAIEIVGASTMNESAMQKHLRSYIGKPIHTGFLEKDLTEIMGSGLYESLSYEFEADEDGPVLVVTVQEKTYGPPFILSNIQVAFDQDQSKFFVGLRMSHMNVAGPGSEVRADFGIGTEPNLFLEFYKPVSDSQWFLATSVSGKRESKSLFDNGIRVTDYKITDYQLACDLGYAFNRFSEGRVGYIGGYQDAKLKIGDPLDADYDGPVRMLRLKWNYNSADDPIIPRRGLAIDSNTNWYFYAPESSNQFGIAENKIRWHVPVGEHDSIFVSLSGGVSTHDDLPLPQQFKLGGLFRLGAYCSGELHGNNYLLGNIGFLKCISQTPTGKNVYFGVWMENGGVYENWSDLKIKNGLSMGLMSSTLLGPVFLSVSYGEDSNLAYYMGMGFLF